MSPDTARQATLIPGRRPETAPAQPPEALGTVLVTGGSGFRAGWCLLELLQRGYRVRTTVRNLAREPEIRTMLAAHADIGDRLCVVEADLTSDTGWPQAADGCAYVPPAAAPFPAKQPADPDELIVPARDGTLRVLRASLAAGVRGVVPTSSTAAVRYASTTPPSRPLTEDDGTDPCNHQLTAYARAKTLAERAA
jgi:dihydroflavonol-4-reductase